LITDKGTLVRTRTEEVSILGRNTQGVRLIKLTQKDEHLIGLERVDEPEQVDDESIDGETEDSLDAGLDATSEATPPSADNENNADEADSAE